MSSSTTYHANQPNLGEMVNKPVVSVVGGVISANPTTTTTTTTVTKSTKTTQSATFWEHIYLDGCGDGDGDGEARLVTEVSVDQLLTTRGYFLMEILSSFDPVLVSSSSGGIVCFPPVSPFPPPLPPPQQHLNSTSSTSDSPKQQQQQHNTSSPSTITTTTPAGTPPSASLLRVYTKKENRRRVILTFRKNKGNEGTHEEGEAEEEEREVTHTPCKMTLSGQFKLRSGYGFMSCRETNPEITNKRLVAWRATVIGMEQETSAARRKIIIGVSIGVLCMVVLCVVCIMCRLRATRKPIPIHRRPSASTRSTGT
ncbi:hypothetical protein Pmani_009639 [Petrolisthes manimaculis]|uniref:Uncharacterized protein n=1 Tax=Petrolisthes manimaculis TaxID=1843537 RepID=A0AAE1Q4D4_9EUCA|nr:hypothetical protein Pmani_009639 [Petrolisthes manimaculis]